MKSALFGLASAVVLCLSPKAFAVSLTLQGRGARIQVDSAQVLYASNSRGRAVLITSVGMPAPDGGRFTELGVPSMMADGRVLFGAEWRDPKDIVRWGIFIGDPERTRGPKVSRALHIKHREPGCSVKFRGDPYPVADSEGAIAFMSAESKVRDALFLYSHGNLTCLAHSGGLTNSGHRIAVLSFGSPQMGNNGEVVFDAFLDNSDPRHRYRHVQAMLIASPALGIRELAVEGELGPNRSRYQRPFGLPAALPSANGTIAAFTAKTPSGGALFLYRGGSTARILPYGTLTPLGPVSYLSPGRPGLMADGTTAVLVGCARSPAVFRLRRGMLDLRLRRGGVTPLGSQFQSLGDPVLTGSGAMFIGATDSEGHERLYVLGDDNGLFEVGRPEVIYQIANRPRHQHSIFTGTLTVNQQGDFAYLGGK